MISFVEGWRDEPTDPYAAYRDKEAAAKRYWQVAGTAPDPKFLKSADSDTMRDIVVGSDVRACIEFARKKIDAGEFEGSRTLITACQADLARFQFSPNVHVYDMGGVSSEVFDQIWETASRLGQHPQAPAMSDLPDADFRAAIEHYTAETIADHDAWLRSIGWMAGDATAEVYGFGERADPKPEPARPIAPPTHPAARVRIVHDSETRMGCGTWAAMPEEPAMYGKKKPKGKGGKRGC